MDGMPPVRSAGNVSTVDGSIRRSTPEPRERGYPDTLRQQAAKMSVDGINYRRIGRLLGVDHKTIMNWVKAHADQLPPAPVPDDVNNAELDELSTFVVVIKNAST